MFSGRLIKALGLASLFLGAVPALAQTETGDVASAVAEWAASAHADANAEAFAHWNDDGEIPAACAACHSSAGFRDFHGLDGSAVGSIEMPIATGGVLDCESCHTPGAMEISSVTFPSGVTVAALTNSGSCMTCHQGRSAGADLEIRLEGQEDDTVNPELGFLNPHYAAAAATLFGSELASLSQYLGQTYDGRFAHVPMADSCVDCHSPHSLEVGADTCAGCHQTAVLTDIRTSTQDFDGDGDVTEGIAHEVAALQDRLAALIMDYARERSGTPIVYVISAYPYYFTDTNGDGIAGDDEATYGNAYHAWTPRLLRAAFNYQFTVRDPGSYAHNPGYVIQILHDSVTDLATALGREDGMGLVRP